MKRKVETRRTGEKSRKCITSTLQELSLRKAFFSDKKHASHQGKEPSLFRACAVFLAKKVFPACYFALHDTLRDTRPIYKVSLEEARYGAAFPGNFVPMFKIGGKCACFRAKMVEISGHLPPSPQPAHLSVH